MGRDRFEITKARIVGGVVLFIVAGLMAYLAIKTLVLSSPEQGQIPMLILFGGISAVFLISGIFIFVFENVFKKIFLTFLIGLSAVVAFSIIAIYINTH